MAFSCTFTPRFLLWISRLGLLYVLTFTCLIFTTGVTEVIPFLYGENENLAAYYILAVYIFIGLTINLIYCYKINSFIEKKDNSSTSTTTAAATTTIQKTNETTKNMECDCVFSSCTETEDNKSLTPVTSCKRNHCNICNVEMPPRSHHCSICQRCVLVREHHCFFIGSCIGQKNLKYFIIFLIYLSFGCIYSLYLNHKYMTIKYVCPLSWNFYEFFPPITLIEILLGYRTWIFGYYVLGMYVALTGFFGSTFAYLWYFLLALMGLTSHEYYTKTPRSKFSRYYNFKKVFGKYWYVIVFLPLPIFEDNSAKFNVKLV